MILNDLLKDRNLVSAVIIDDAYDKVPKASDLAADDEAWSTFIADIGDDEAILVQAFPAYEHMSATDLKHSDDFVAAAWAARDKLKPALFELLFGNYENGIKSDRAFLEQLEEALTALGIKPIPSGRTLPAEAATASIIFADLFLGVGQDEHDTRLSIDIVKQLVAGREEAPPPVILMSRSDLLHDKKAAFRDDARLMGALFRVYRKQTLLEADNLSRALERLATHYRDAVRIAAFLTRYENGMKAATARLFKTARRLDLSDYGQIRDVLLAFEGQPIGSYLLDVFDSALQYEVEADLPTIEAAEKLTNIDPANYPAPHIAGSPDLQDMMARTIWHNRERLAVRSTMIDLAVGFGDVLLRKNDVDAADPNADRPDAFVILTPACDLVRKDGAKRLLLLAGRASQLTHKSWSYKNAGLKTPVAILKDDTRVSLTWDSSDLRMLTHAELNSLVAADGPYYIFQRLRESHALELQQSLLAQMGRVGLSAKMPATFAVEVEVSFPAKDGVLKALDVPSLRRDGGVCYVGRHEDSSENARLVLTEEAIDELMAAVATLSEDDVAPKSKEFLKRLKASTSFAKKLQTGLAVAASNKAGFTPIKAEAVGTDGAVVEEIIGHVARDPTGLPSNSQGGLILVLRHEKEPNVTAGVVNAETKGPALGVV
ncbi:hypothetical protein G6L05_21625 [Agrobacterium rhizogenes]|nr:hypothetical protein [Rhizobium rhizogenes]